MTFHYRYRKQIAIAIIIIIAISCSIGFAVYKYQTKPKKKAIDTIKIKKKDKISIEKETNPKEEYMVDIKGEVNAPGIYKLKEESRIIDVIEKAGGLTKNADTTVINLSKKIKDEMVIIIYSKNQVQNWLVTKEQEKYLQEKCKTPEAGKVTNESWREETEKETILSESININQATKEELMTLPGIGETKADAIITYREQTPFESIEDLKKVSGIGEKTYEELKTYITV